MQPWLALVSVLGIAGCASAAPSRRAQLVGPAPATLATLQVDEPAGALLYVDDTAVGLVPSWVVLEPGVHEVELFAEGHVAHRRRVELAPGERREVNVDLEATPQRIASFLLLGVGAASVTAGVAFGAAAAVRRGGGVQEVTGEDGAELLTLGAGLSGGLGALLIVTGGALFVLDVPALPDDPVAAQVTVGPTGVTARF